MNRSIRSVLLAVTSSVAALSMVTVGFTTAAQASPVSTVSGSFSWGLDSKNYANIFESRDQEGEASWNEDNTVATFPIDADASGYDAESQRAVLSFTGAVRIGYTLSTGDPGTVLGNYFYLKAPHIVIDGNQGKIVATTVAGSSHDLVSDLPTASGTNVDIARLDLSEVSASEADGVITWQDVPATITADGARYLASYTSSDRTVPPTVRTAGSALDPVTFSVSLGNDELPALTDPQYPSTGIYGYDSTIQAGYVPRDMVVDSKHNIMWFPHNYQVGWSPEKAGISYFDLATGTVSTDIISTPAEPENLLLDTDASRLYVVHYRGKTNTDVQTVITVIDTDSKQVVDEITGIRRYATAPVIDTVNKYIYFGATTSDRTSSDSLYAVNLQTKQITESRLPGSSQADLAGLALDTHAHLLYVSSTADGAIWTFNTAQQSFVDQFAAVTRVGDLALDVTRHRLVALFNKRNGEQGSVRSFNTATGEVTAKQIAVQNTPREIAIVPETGLVIVSNGFSNTVSILSIPQRALVDTIDLGAAGVVDQISPFAATTVRSVNSDVWALEVDPATSNIYVSHPYWIDGFSVLTQLSDVPDDDGNDDAEAVDSDPITTPEAPEAPAAPAVPHAPDGATKVTQAQFSWGISDYATTFSQRYAFTQAQFDKDGVFTFSDGEGWYDKSTQQLSVTWEGIVQYKPYGSMAPVEFIFANPVLTATGDGTGTLSFDVRWNNGGGLVSEYQRVVVATFPMNVNVSATSATFTVSPDFLGRPYTPPESDYVAPNSFPAEFLDFLDAQIRPWWYTSGASLDGLKQPLTITGSLTLQSNTPSTATAQPTVTISAADNASYGVKHAVQVKVVAQGKAAQGSVALRVDGKLFATAALNSQGAKTFFLPATLAAGKHRLEATYSGNATTKTAKATRALAITKAGTKVTLKLSKKTVKRGAKKVKARLSVKVNGSAISAAGKATILVRGKKVTTVTFKAKDKGKKSVTLPRITKRGKAKVKVKFLATNNTKAGASKNVTLRVR